jgi:2-polyprenyl-3-methyl-5-hydroxy-6-metoxy-1,4-benzoquinol methylase
MKESCIYKISIEMIRLTISPNYMEKKSIKFWSNTESPQTNLSYDKNFEEINQIINPKVDQEILDYGCCSGELTLRFKEKGYKIEACDVNHKTIKKTKELGIKCYSTKKFLRIKKKFNIIYISNAYSCILYSFIQKKEELSKF